ncbi:MAG TPA: hypothetical protein PLD09_02745 [Methanomassiliicoccaceae archaeon]|nr:hypothetical protein [Methanomassiliicoccaceae archaeon]
MSAELKDVVRKYALQNAALYGGKANPKAVMGKVMAERPELRSRAERWLPPLKRSAVNWQACRSMTSAGWPRTWIQNY